MTRMFFVTDIDGLTFDANGQTWTLEVDGVEDSQPHRLSMTVRASKTEAKIHVDAPRIVSN
jgi:hypothetical protein